MPKKQVKYRWFRVARFLCRVFCKIFFRLRVYGKNNIPEDGAFLLLSNHQSFLDPLFCGINMKRPLHFLARDTLFASRFFGWLIRSVNTIPVRRGQADLTAMKTVLHRLREGYGVCLFPEGTRSEDGRIRQLKPGFGLLCRRGNAAVVPVVIEGAFECWPKGKKIFTSGSRIAVRYGECITAERAREMGDKELAETITDTLRRMQNDCRAELGREPFDY